MFVDGDLTYDDLAPKIRNNESLNLSERDLPRFPPDICKFTQLTYINVSHNQIRCLDGDFGRLVHLETLNASYNELQSVPESICHLPSLSSLLLQSNQIQELSLDLAKMKSLRYLVLSQNPLPDAFKPGKDAKSTQILICRYFGGQVIATRSVITFLCIRWKRASVLSIIPKEIVKKIARYLFQSRKDQIWNGGKGWGEETANWFVRHPDFCHLFTDGLQRASMTEKKKDFAKQFNSLPNYTGDRYVDTRPPPQKHKICIIN